MTIEREFPRYFYSVEVFRDDGTYLGESENLSLKGLALLAKSPLPLKNGQRYSIYLKSKLPNHPIVPAHAEIKWIKECLFEDNSVKAGILLEPFDQEQMDSFIKTIKPLASHTCF